MGLTYSAAVWLSVRLQRRHTRGPAQPGEVQARELQVPSLPSVEANSIRRLVRDYVLRDGLTEDRALDKRCASTPAAHGRGCPAGRIA